MNAQPPTHAIPRPEAAAFARAIDGILLNLMRLVSARHAIFGALARLLTRRLNRANNRLAALLTRIAAGTYRARTRASQAGRPGGACAPQLPRQRGWLVWQLGYHAAGNASQLRHLLQDPAMAAIVAEHPSLGRTLRPLCRLLAIDIPAITGTEPPQPDPARARRVPRPANRFAPTQAPIMHPIGPPPSVAYRPT